MTSPCSISISIILYPQFVPAFTGALLCSRFYSIAFIPQKKQN